MKYCENCETYVESIEDRCPLCNEMFVIKKERYEFDRWEEEDEEWSDEDLIGKYGDLRGGERND